MQVEFLGGPVDGHRMEIPDGSKLYVVSTPAMSPAEFIAAQERPDLIAYATMQAREFAYEDTQRIAQSGLRLFRLMGERVTK